MSLISKLFSLAGTDANFSELREAVQQNETDEKFIRSFAARTGEDEKTLAALQAEFRQNPSAKLADEIVALFVAIQAEKPIRAQLSDDSRHAVKSRCESRTRQPLRAALESVASRLETELEASRANDLRFANSGMNTLGYDGVINAGMKSDSERAAMLVSPATRILQKELENCASYLTRLDAMDISTMRGAIRFCLDEK